MLALLKSNKLFALVVAFIGSSFVGLVPLFVKATEQGPLVVGFYRILFALPFLALWMGSERREGVKEPLKKRDYLFLVGYGILFALDMGIWNLSIRYTSVVDASLFNNFCAFFMPLLLWLFYKERPTKRYLQGALLALLGSFFLTGGNVSLSGASLFGDFLALTSALCYAGYLILINQLRKAFGPGTILFFGGFFALASLTVLSLFNGGITLPTSAFDLAILLGIALCSQVGGQGLITYSMKKLSPAVLGLILLTQPVVSACLAYLFFQEPVSALSALGGSLILGSLWWVQRRTSATA